MQTLKEPLMSQLAKLSVRGHQATKLWSEQFPFWSQSIHADSTMLLFRKVNGERKDFARDSLTHNIVKRLAECWKCEFIDPLPEPTRKRTRDDTNSQPAPLPDHWKKQMQDIVDLAMTQRDAALKSDFSKEMNDIKQLIVAGFRQAQEIAPVAGPSNLAIGNA